MDEPASGFCISVQKNSRMKIGAIIFYLFFSFMTLHASNHDLRFRPFLTLNIPSLIKSSELIANLGTSAFPRLADHVVMGTVALTMNAEFSDFDMSEPISLSFLYSDRADISEPYVFCIITTKKRNTLPKVVKSGKMTLYPVSFADEDRVYLLSSEMLANTANKETFKQCVPMSGEPGSFIFTFDRNALGKSFSLADIMMPFFNPEISDQEESRIRREKQLFKFKQIDSYLKRFDRCEITMLPSPDALTLDIVFSKNGSNQELRKTESVKSSSLLKKEVPVSASIAARLNLGELEPFRNVLAEIFADYAEKTGEPENVALLFNLIPQAAINDILISSGLEQGAFFSRTDITVESDKRASIASALLESKRTTIPFLWLIRNYNSGSFKLYCRNFPSTPEVFSFYYTELEEVYFSEFLKNTMIMEFPDAGLLRMMDVHDKNAEPLLTFDFPDDYTVLTKIRMSPGILKTFLNMAGPLFQ